LAFNQDVSRWEAHKQYILSARQGISDLKQEWEYLMGEGNYFALTYKMSGMFTGEIPGFPPPTGKELTAYSLFLFRLQNGKIAEAWSNGTNTGLG
jgi:predicted ester cyclase